MRIQRVRLENFRNIADLDINLGCGMNVLFGDNAQGKTNFLESVYFCATGRSHRTGRDRDLLKIGANAARAKVFVDDEGFDDNIGVEIDKMGKKMWVNGLLIKRLGELFGHLLCVIFSPEDLSLVKAGPGLRRRFMDMELCQLYPAYYHNLRMYYKIMKQRNNLLRDITSKPALIDTLEVWDEQLATYGMAIIAARAAFIERLSRIANQNQGEITGGLESLEIIYKNNVDSELFLEKLTKARNFDITRKSTSVGIHKDDMEFRINGRDGRIFASQGQQRTAALSVKLAQITLIEEERGKMPVLLLDDLLSELDASRQKFLMERTRGLQSIITLTGAESAFDNYLNQEGAKIFRVEKGEIMCYN
ncbi:MAG: DNA replication/repair protein RecF [Clostridiales bacterium]|jgi:DNA replication and repair protein RecF|nr:DNA replication/repair protein RecF [Clostridiales bacterium]